MTAPRSERLRILVSGMIAAVPHHGGATWAVLQYLLGFARLGHDVTFVEQLDGDVPDLERSPNAAYMRRRGGALRAGRPLGAAACRHA